MTITQKEKVRNELEKGSWHITNALNLAQAYGWDTAEGFISGESFGCMVCILREGNDDDKNRASSAKLSAKIPLFDCGAW
jgi:hypothetical protein